MIGWLVTLRSVWISVDFNVSSVFFVVTLGVGVRVLPFLPCFGFFLFCLFFDQQEVNHLEGSAFKSNKNILASYLYESIVVLWRESGIVSLATRPS